MTRRGIHEKVAILAGIQPLCNGALASAQAGHRRLAAIPEAVLDAILASSDPASQRATAIQIALETIERLSAFRGLRGLSISGDGDLDAAST